MDNPVNLLLVDDQPENLVVLESLLARPEYQLTMVASAQEALMSLLQTEFALIVLDVEMPGMNGIELARVIKDRKKTADVPIIFLTAHRDDERHILSGYSVGAVDYVTKPLNSVILQSKVAVFVDLFLKNRALKAANEALQREILERERGEGQLRESARELEEKESVRKQLATTAEELRVKAEALKEHARALEIEVEHRRQAEDQLRKTEQERIELLEREQAARAIAETASRTKDEFLAMLGHELRNPLAPIVTALQLMRAKGDIVFEKEQSIIERQVDHLARLVDDLLDVARITQGKIELKKRDIELAETVAKAIEVVSPLFESKDHTVEILVPETGMRLHADSLRISQVLANLLTNAAKYTPTGGKISLTTKRKDGQILISIKDSGVGINSELLPVVFDLFVQGKRTLDRGEGGLGIGLALARSFVQMHGGSIAAHSAGQGKGTEFVISLPALEKPASAQSAAPRKNDVTKRRAATPRKVLVVDDNVDAADVLAAVLSLAGHEVVVAYDGAEALDLVKGFTPEVAVLDIGLPIMDGYELAKRLRQQLGATCPRMMALTGYGQEGDRIRSKEAGFERHLVKPMSADVVLAAIDS